MTSTLTAFIRPDHPPYGIAGYVFDVVESYMVEMKSSATDKVLEESDKENDRSKSIKFKDDKQYVKPWIKTEPETITVKGLVAEVTSAVPAPLENVERYVRALEPVMAYVPVFARNVQKAYAEAERIVRVRDKLVKQVTSLHDLYTKLGEAKKAPGKAPSDVPQSKQRDVFAFFRYLWASKQLVTVETAWGVYKQMAITSITATQDSSHYLSSFTMVFKQLVTVKAEDLKKNMSTGAEKYLNKGNTSGIRVELEEAFKDFPATSKESASTKSLA